MPRRIRIRLAQFLCVTLGVTAGVAVTGSASAAVLLPYQDPTLPVTTRVDDLLSRMTLDEKLGQMTQAERGSVSASDITTYRLGSILSGGGSSPSPDAAVVDIRMPPTHTDEGLTAARRIRTQVPGTAVVLLSQYLEPRYAERLLADQPGGLGYLLKERVSDIAVLVDALRRVTEGECVIDPTIVSRLMRRRGAGSLVAVLTPRERDILGLMAQGRSNHAIANELSISERTVEAASAQLFRKLGLEQSPNVNRRVLAVLQILRG